MTIPAKKGYWKPYVFVFLTVLIGFVVSQWSRSRSVSPYAERRIQMSELSESMSVEERTSWQKYRTRKRLGLEDPASPESMLIIDMLQSCKLEEKTKHVDGAKPVE